MRQVLRFGAAQSTGDGRRIRDAHFVAESTFPLTTACLVANGVRERFAQKLGRAHAVDLFEPVAVTCGLLDRLLTGATVFVVEAATGRFWLVLGAQSVVTLVSAAFGESGVRPAGVLSGLESRALSAMARELASLCAPLYGEPTSLTPTHDYLPMYEAASYFEVRIALEHSVYIGILLEHEPNDERHGSTIGAAHLAEMTLTMRGIAGSCRVTLAQLGSLEIGDVLPMIRGESAQLAAGGAFLARGTCGIANGHTAFLIESSGDSSTS